MARPPGWFRISLRELLLLVAWAAIGCAALKTAGNLWWTVLSALTLLMLMGLAVIAAVERGSRQAFAIGFLLWALIYGYLVNTNQNTQAGHSREFDPYDGQLPTTRAMYPLFEAMVSRKWIDIGTGMEVPGPNAASKNEFGLSQIGGSESPERHEFMRIAHLLWTLLLGYIGGRFGQWIYRRRIHREQLPVGTASNDP